MSIATSTAIGIAGIAGIAGAGISAFGANAAAGKQASAADQAAQLQYQESQNALDWQKQMFGIQEGLAMPWITTGQNSLNELNNLFGLPSSATSSTTGAVPNGMPMLPTGTNGVNFGALNPNLLNGAGLSPMTGPGPSIQPNIGEARRQSPIDPSQVGPQTIFPVGQPNPTASAQPGQATVPNPATATPTATPGATAPNLGVTNPNSYFQPFQNWTQQFVAPTADTMQLDPAYKFDVQQGEQAIQNSAAANGTLLTGGTAKDLNNYVENQASNEYSNIYNRALGQYQQNYNIFQNNQGTEFNRLMALAGMGQTGTAQLNSAANSSASNIANTDLTAGAQIGANINNAGAARASGYVGGTNAISGGLSNLGNLGLLYQLYGNGGGGAGGNPSLADLSTITG